MLESIFNIISKLVLSIISFLKIVFRSSFFYKKALIQEDNCFILGNGPSLAAVINRHTNFFKESNLLCVNGFSSTNLFEVVKPKYFIFTAPEIWSNKATDVENMKVRSAMVNDLISKTSWDLRLFLPTNAKKNAAFINSISKNQNISISFFNTTPVEGLKQISWFFYKLGLGMPRPHNVIIPSLMIAIRSNVKVINLFGVDHSWLPLIHVDKNNNALLKQEHFYDEKTAKAVPMNYLGQRKRMLHEILEKFYFTFRSYVEIEEYAKNKKVNIYNCSENSFIDAFQRKSFQEIQQSN